MSTPPQPPTIAVILPVRDHSAAYERALDSIVAASPAAEETVVVVDGGSATAADAARRRGLRVIERRRSGGPAAARNDGARAVAADVLLFVDADVALHADLVGRVKGLFAGASLDAAVGCYDDAPPERNFASQYKHLLQRYVHLRARSEGSTFWGACGAIRRHVFLQAGGFDERYDRPSIEDIELGYRLTAAGRRIAFVPELQVTHLKRWTLVSLVRSDVFRRALPWTWVLLRRSRVDADLNLDHRSRAAGIASVLLALSLMAAPVWPRALGASAALMMLLTALDFGLWRYFNRARGPWFATRAVLWHWVYYAYSTLTFAAGVLMYPLIGRRRVHPDGARLLDAVPVEPTRIVR